jgi:hypothetical protein
LPLARKLQILRNLEQICGLEIIYLLSQNLLLD